LEYKTAKMQTGWLRHNWTPPIRVAWILCAVASAWLLGRDDYLGGEGDQHMGTSTETLSTVASVLGLALGVAMFRERHTSSIVAPVSLAASLATFSMLLSEVFNPFFDFVYFAVMLGIPVGIGVLLGALWGWVQRLVANKATRGQ